MCCDCDCVCVCDCRGLGLEPDALGLGVRVHARREREGSPPKRRVWKRFSKAGVSGGGMIGVEWGSGSG